jgi:hypothetical protein
MEVDFMRRKLLALFLVLCLVLPLIPAVTQAEDVTTFEDVLVADDFSATSTTYTDFSGVTSLSGAVYAGNSAKALDDAIQLRSKSNSGIVTTVSGGKATKIVVSWNKKTGENKQLDIYGKNEAYTASSDLYNSTQQGTQIGSIICGSSTEIDITGDYEYIGLRSNSGDIYLDVIEITWEIESAPVTPSPTAEPTATPEPSPTAEPNDSKTYVLVTEEKELASGSTYLIASSGEEGNAYAMSYQKTNNRHAVGTFVRDDLSIVLSSDAIATDSYDQINVHEFIVCYDTIGETQGWSFYSTASKSYLFPNGSMNTLRSQGNNSVKGLFNVSVESNGAITAESIGEETYRYLCWNESNSLFSCYEEGNMDPIYLYKLVDGTEPPADKPVFMSESLVLSGQIGVNFYMDLSMLQQDQMKDCFMEFTIGTDKKPVIQRVYYNESIKNPTGEYDGFTCKVNAIQMADPIEATFHYKAEDGTEQTVSRDTQFTVRMYIAKCMLDSTTTEAEETLASSLADYGHFVQIYLSELRNWVLGEDYTTIYSYGKDENSLETHFGSEEVEQIKNALNGYSIDRTNHSEAIERITYSLVLDSETAIRVYFKMKDGYEGTFAVTLDDNAYTAKKVGGRYLVEIKGISAHKLGVKHTIDVQTDDNGSAHVEVSALSYVKSMLEQKTGETDADTKARDAVCAIYYYHSAAQALLNQ